MKKMVVAVLGLLMICSTTAFAQTQDDLDTKFERLFPFMFPSVNDFKGGGARAQGMGNAFLAISDDLSAITWNPAGLYGQEEVAMSLAYGAYVPQGTYSELSQQWDRDDVFKSVTMLSVVTPLRVKGHPFVGSLSYGRAGDEYYTTQSVYVDPDYVYYDRQNTPQPGLYRLSTEAEYHAGPDVINVGFGTRLASKLYSGVALNIYTGKGTANQEFLEETDITRQIDMFQPVRLNSRAAAIDTSRYSGISLTVGFKYDAEPLTAGLVVRTPFTLQQNTNRTVVGRNTINGNSIQEGTGQVHFDRIISKIDFPVQVGAGIGYRPSEDWILALDVEYKPFSGNKIKVRDTLLIIPGEKDQEIYSERNPYWQDVLTVRAGTEYLWQTGSKLLPVVALRGGFGYIPIPRPNTSVATLWPDPEPSSLPDSIFSSTSAIAVSAGTGIRWGQIQIDLAYTHTTLDREYAGSAIGLENKDHMFNFTFSGVF